MSDLFLKKNIDGVFVPQFQFSHIHVTQIILHQSLVKLCPDLHYLRWGNQDF